MVATELTSPHRYLARRGWLPAGLRKMWLCAYACVWVLTLSTAAIVALAGRPLAVSVRRVLGLSLSAARNPRPQLGHIVALAAHNIPIVCWPLLLGVLGVHRHRLARHVADGVLLVCVVANTLPVGAALGAYGISLLVFIPQLPVEWAGLAFGMGGWLIQRKNPLSVGEGMGLFALICVVQFCAATIEVMATPHA